MTPAATTPDPTGPRWPRLEAVLAAVAPGWAVRRAAARRHLAAAEFAARLRAYHPTAPPAAPYVTRHRLDRRA